jgi:hypothetical protein
MSQRTHPTTRTLRQRPHLDQLRRQARELLEAYAGGDPHAAAEIHAHYHGADPATFALHDAHLVIARAYGFQSWPKLKAFIDGVTVKRLASAIRDGDIEGVRAMLVARPELVNVDQGENDEHKPLHIAVLARQTEIVRFLMQRGADPHCGIWPHRDATGALTMADERGEVEIAAIIRDEASRRAHVRPESLDEKGTNHDEETARDAIARGDAAWLRTRHAEGRLADQRGLVTHAVRWQRPEILSLLLELGLDPDEAGRLGGLDEDVTTWGGPLRDAVIAGRRDLVQILLAHGANPNTGVYAASSALFEAHQRGDQQTRQMLEQRGARFGPSFVGELGLIEQAAEWLAGDVANGSHAAGEAPTVARELIWGAMGSPSPEIVRLALPHIDWPRDDGQWHGLLENGLYLGRKSDRARHLEAFRLVLDRCDPDVRSGRGTTLLHEVAAARGGLTADDRIVYATVLLDAGARLDVRDHLLESTPLGWACRWGRIELVRLFIARGADPGEPDARPWASPAAWARKKQYDEVLAELRSPR